MAQAPRPWRLRDLGPGFAPCLIEDGDGHMVATAVPPEHVPLILAAPAMLDTLREVDEALTDLGWRGVLTRVRAAIDAAGSPTMSKSPAEPVTAHDTLSPHGAPPQAP